MTLAYINGPTEGLFIACSIMILSGIYGVTEFKLIYHLRLMRRCIFHLSGPHIWLLELSTLLPSMRLWLPKWRVVEAIAYSMISILFLFQIPLRYFHGNCHPWKRMDRLYRLQEKKTLLLKCARGRVPNFGIRDVVVGLAVCSRLSHQLPPSPSFHPLYWHNFWIHGRTCILDHFITLQSSIILNFVTRMPMPLRSLILIQSPLIFGALLARLKMLGGQSEWYFFYSSFLLVFLVYITWTVVVVRQFCKHLKIHCFTIPIKKE